MNIALQLVQAMLSGRYCLGSRQQMESRVSWNGSSRCTLRRRSHSEWAVSLRSLRELQPQPRQHRHRGEGAAKRKSLRQSKTSRTDIQPDQPQPDRIVAEAEIPPPPRCTCCHGMTIGVEEKVVKDDPDHKRNHGVEEAGHPLVMHQTAATYSSRLLVPVSDLRHGIVAPPCPWACRNRHVTPK